MKQWHRLQSVCLFFGFWLTKPIDPPCRVGFNGLALEGRASARPNEVFLKAALAAEAELFGARSRATSFK